MSRKLLVLFLMYLPFFISGQTINRIEVIGNLLSSNNDVEAVTVFNKSSNKGTITDNDGQFKLHVALNDIIEVSALQFQSVAITIDAVVIASKSLKIQLIEEVNKLDAVTLSSGLSGDISTDISNVKNVKPILLEMGNMNLDFEYNDDKAFDNIATQNHLTAIINPDARNYLPDVIKIIGLFTKGKKTKKLKKGVLIDNKYKRPKELLNVFSLNFIQKQFEIPEDKIQLFLAFIEKNGVNQELLKPENEIQLIEFLIKQSQQFLKQQNIEN